MKIVATEIIGLYIIETMSYTDSRGAFARWYCEKELVSVMGSRRIVQVNHSRTTTAGATRGMHFQRPPHAEMKLVRCLRGKVWDVAVDLRVGSPTFLQWHAEELSAGNKRLMAIPEGFAHGFQALEPDSEVLYLHTEFYTPESEDGLRHDDSRLGIQWPLEVTDLSERDSAHPLIRDDFQGLEI